MQSLSNLCLRDIASTAFSTVGPDALLDDVLRLFAERQAWALIVVAADEPLGIVTEGEVPRLLAEHGDPATVRVGDVMSRDLQGIAADSSVLEAAWQMERAQRRHLVVLDAGKRLLGVVSQHHLGECLGIALLGERRSQLEGRLDVVLEATGVGTWEYDHRLGLVLRSASLNKLFAFAAEMHHDTLDSVLERIDPDDRPIARSAFDAVLHGRTDRLSVDYRERGGDGKMRWVSVRGRVVDTDATGVPRRVVGATIDLTERHHQQALLELSNAILQRISLALPLAELLDFITREIEARMPGIRCSVQLLDADGLHLRHGAAPGLPADYAAAIDGMPIGPRVGSCGTAAYRDTPVFVADIASDPLWADYRELAARHGLGACWSTPIRASTGGVLGTFAIYWPKPCAEVDPLLRKYVDTATRLAAIAIENARHEAQLRGVIDELRRWQQLTLGREGRVLELKREVNELLGRLGEVPRYGSVADEASA